jgi:hypothetical protein
MSEQHKQIALAQAADLPGDRDLATQQILGKGANLGVHSAKSHEHHLH